MNTYKITNITNLAPKRDRKFNSVIDIEYVDGRTKKTIKLKAGDNVFLTINSLSLSTHRLRIKKLITIDEINAIQLAKSMEKPKPVQKPKSVKKPIVVEKKKEIVEPIAQKKPTIRKKTVEKY